MKIRKSLILSLLMIISIGLFGTISVSPSQVQATEGGGQVNRGGKITFYEESSSSEEPKPSTEPSTVDSSGLTMTKPKGRLPDTGELVKQYGWIGGALLLLVALLLFMRNRKKGDQK